MPLINFILLDSSMLSRISNHLVFLQVMASKTKIFIVLEYVTGGELFDKIVR